MQILNIAGYKFIALSDTTFLREYFLNRCHALGLKGTIILSHEGINVSLAGTISSILAFKKTLKEDQRFADICFKQTYSAKQPFKRLKIKLKKEIISFGVHEVNAIEARAPLLTPKVLKKWLDEKRDIIVLDARNDYEVSFGTFKNAIHLALKNFISFPKAVTALEKDKPIITFCTGGIRCEKAALLMLNQGFTEVYQLEGGILNYFAEVGGDYYEGECFVFDDRISLNSNLQETGTLQCTHCQGPIKGDHVCNPESLTPSL